jgi:hypothetical protein
MSEVRRDDSCQNARVRIGTWTLEGKWSSDHLALLKEQECVVWLLNEVPSEVSIPDTTAHRTSHALCPGKGWAAIFSSRDLTTQMDSHPATPSSLRERINETTVWGGDGNQALDGRERPSVHRPVFALDREVPALGLLATSDGGAT